MNRREFLHTTVGVAAVSALRPARAQPSTGVLGANERVRMGVIGCGVRGNQVLSAFGKSANNVFVAACDVSKDRLDQTVAKMTAAGTATIDSYEDYRRVLDRKDVYVEKPLSNAVDPAWKMVEAARRHNRVVQVGLEQRSWPSPLGSSWRRSHRAC